MLVFNSTALKLRSFFVLLFLVGMVNMATANTYYSYNATTGSAVTLTATNTGTTVTSGTLYTFSGGVYTAVTGGTLVTSADNLVSGGYSGSVGSITITTAIATWVTGTNYSSVGANVYCNGNIYSVATAGTATSTAPSNTSGNSSGTGAIFTFVGSYLRFASLTVNNYGTITLSSSIYNLGTTTVNTGGILTISAAGTSVNATNFVGDITLNGASAASFGKINVGGYTVVNGALVMVGGTLNFTLTGTSMKVGGAFAGDNLGGSLGYGAITSTNTSTTATIVLTGGSLGSGGAITPAGVVSYGTSPTSQILWGNFLKTQQKEPLLMGILLIPLASKLIQM